MVLQSHCDCPPSVWIPEPILQPHGAVPVRVLTAPSASVLQIASAQLLLQPLRVRQPLRVNELESQLQPLRVRQPLHVLSHLHVHQHHHTQLGGLHHV